MIRDRDTADETDAEGRVVELILATGDADRALALELAVDIARPGAKPADVLATAEAFLGFLIGRVAH